MTKISFQTPLPVTAEEAFAWHMRPLAFERLTPPWEEMKVLESHGTIAAGVRTKILIELGPIVIPWSVLYSDFKEGKSFTDTMESGPFSSWKHTHSFHPAGPNSCYLADEIEYELPLGLFGRTLAKDFVKNRIARMFRYRQDVLRHDLALTNRWGNEKPLRILLSGANGMLGSALVPFLSAAGHHVTRLVRRADSGSVPTLTWQPEKGEIPTEQLEGFDVFVNLAGENIADSSWTPERKLRLRESRLRSTALLVDSIRSLKHPPQVFLNASAVGIYGSQSDLMLTEASAPGVGFLADLVKDWESVAMEAQSICRVATLRFGAILSPKGGALKKSLLPFKLGLGGTMGPGSQFIPWISIDDCLGAIYQCLNDKNITGGVNLVSPEPVTSKDFSQTLAKVLHRPSVMPVPAQVLKMAMGELADEVLLSSCRAIPEKLLANEYAFRHPHLESALRHVLGRAVNDEA